MKVISDVSLWIRPSRREDEECRRIKASYLEGFTFLVITIETLRLYMTEL